MSWSATNIKIDKKNIKGKGKNEVVEETKPEINHEVGETFNKIFEEYIKEHILVFTIENQEPKELTPEKKEAYAQSVKE